MKIIGLINDKVKHSDQTLCDGRTNLEDYRSNESSTYQTFERN